MHRVRKENTEEEDDEGHILDGVADEENTDKEIGRMFPLKLEILSLTYTKVIGTLEKS